MSETPLTNPRLLAQFTGYGFLIALLGALTPELIKDFSKWWWIWLLNLTAILVAIRRYDPQLRRWIQQRRAPLRITESTQVRRAKGLILLISRGDGSSSALHAIDYHRDSLSHVWLIHSTDSAADAHRIEQHCKATIPGITIEKEQLSGIFSISAVERVKSLIDRIRDDASHIPAHDLVCDFTGMNKLVGAGVVLACVRPEHRLEYMEPNQFLPDGRPDPQAGAHPVEVDVNYELT